MGRVLKALWVSGASYTQPWLRISPKTRKATEKERSSKHHRPGPGPGESEQASHSRGGGGVAVPGTGASHHWIRSRVLLYVSKTSSPPEKSLPLATISPSASLEEMKHGGDQWSKSQEFLEQPAIEESPVWSKGDLGTSQGLLPDSLGLLVFVFDYYFLLVDRQLCEK